MVAQTYNTSIQVAEADHELKAFIMRLYNETMPLNNQTKPITQPKRVIPRETKQTKIPNPNKQQQNNRSKQNKLKNDKELHHIPPTHFLTNTYIS